jgi:hypothetical protein
LQLLWRIARTAGLNPHLHTAPAVLVDLSRLAEQRQRGRLVGQDQDVFAAVVTLRSLEMGRRLSAGRADP